MSLQPLDSRVRPNDPAVLILQNQIANAAEKVRNRRKKTFEKPSSGRRSERAIDSKAYAWLLGMMTILWNLVD